MDEKICNEKTKRLEEKINANTSAINGLKDIFKSINELTRVVDKLATETKHMREEQNELKININNIGERVGIIEKKPAKKWEDFLWYLFITFASGGIGFIISSFLK